MKLFETAVNNCEFLGMEWNDVSKKYVFAKKFMVISLLSIPCIVQTTLFLIYDAKTFYDYTLISMLFLTAILCCIVNTILKIQVNLLNNWFENWQNFISESK